MIQNNKRVNLIILLAALVTIVSIVVASVMKVDEVVNTNGDSESVVTQINIAQVYNSKGDKTLEKIPTRLSNGTYHININIKKIDDYTPVYLKFISVNTLYSVSLDGQIIFQNNDAPKLKNLGYPSVNLVRVPNQSDNSKLKITFRSSLKNAKFTDIPRIYIGSKNSLIVDARNRNYVELLFGVLIFVISYITFFVAVFLFKSKTNYSQAFYLSVFSLIMSIAIILNSEFTKVILSENVYLYYIHYILFSVVSMPLLLLVYYQINRINAGNWRRKLLQYTIYIQILIVLLELLTIVVYYRQPINLHIFVFLNVALALTSASLAIFTISHKRHKIKPALILAMIPIFFITFEKFELYFGLRSAAKTFYFTPIFALVFLIIYFYIALNTYYTSYKQFKITKYYENIAYVDRLTKVRTRHALENDIQHIQDQNSKKLIIIFIDVNHLKRINDVHGHAVGDSVLKTLGELINQAERIYDNVTGYRFGGDEFIIIIKKPDAIVAENIRQFLKERTAAIRNSDPKIPISLAIAFDEITVEKDMTIDDIIKSADKKMYLDKEKN